MTEVIHLLSGLAFGVLAWVLLKTQKQRDLLRGLWREVGFQDAGRARVVVDYPGRYLKRLCEALEIEFDQGNWQMSKSKAKRIDISRVTKTLLTGNFSLVGCYITSIDNQGELTAELAVRGESSGGDELRSSLSQALGSQVLLKFVN